MSRKLFSGLSNAEVTGRGKYFEAGEHVVEIAKCMIHESQKDTRSFAIVETSVVESSAHPKGDERTWLIDMSKRSALGNLKGFAVATMTELVNGTETRSMDLEPFTASDDSDMARDFSAAIKGLGTSTLEADKVKAFADFEAFEYIVGDMFEGSSPVGTRLYLRTWQTETKSGGTFTVHDWKPCDENALGRVRAATAKTAPDLQ